MVAIISKGLRKEVLKEANSKRPQNFEDMVKMYFHHIKRSGVKWTDEEILFKAKQIANNLLKS